MYLRETLQKEGISGKCWEVGRCFTLMLRSPSSLALGKKKFRQITNLFLQTFFAYEANFKDVKQKVDYWYGPGCTAH